MVVPSSRSPRSTKCRSSFRRCQRIQLELYQRIQDKRRSRLTTIVLLGCILLSTLLGLYTFASFPTLPSRWAPWRTIESSPSGIVIGSHVYPGESKWTGKIQGYTVFEDLWYHDKVFCRSLPPSFEGDRLTCRLFWSKFGYAPSDG